jgi:hypothetical protein
VLQSGIESHIESLNQEDPEKPPEEIIAQASEGVLNLVGKQLLKLLTEVFQSTATDDEGVEQPLFDEGLAASISESEDFSIGHGQYFAFIESQVKGAFAQLRRYGILADGGEGITVDRLQMFINEVSDRIAKADQLLELANVLSAQAQAEAETEKEYEDGKAKEKRTQSMEKLVSAIKALFGENFIVLPTFSIPDEDNFKTYFAAQDQVLLSNSITRVYLWLQQVSQTHAGIQRLEDMLLLTEAWVTTAAISVYIVQLPYQIEDDNLTNSLGWQALSNEELGIVHNTEDEIEAREEAIREKRPRGTTSLTLFSDGQITSDRVCGLVMDQWIEHLPHETVDTAIALNADTPNQQAPNCCLLAVPSVRRRSRRWTPGELEAIVSDTLDLARIRAVDLDALPDLKGLLPIVHLPISPEQDFFDETPVLKKISELNFFIQ